MVYFFRTSIPKLYFGFIFFSYIFHTFNSYIWGLPVADITASTVGETHDKGEEAPRAEISDLMSNLPTVVIKC